jgi:hypothetical protein
MKVTFPAIMIPFPRIVLLIGFVLVEQVQVIPSFLMPEQKSGATKI